MNDFSAVQVFSRQIGHTLSVLWLSTQLSTWKTQMQKDPSQAGDTPEQNLQVAEQWKISFVFHN